MKRLIFILPLLLTIAAKAQTTPHLTEDNATADSLYIEETENEPGPEKVLHAEPLFIDLIRDLGARKGEREWNVGLGLTDNNAYDEYTALVEYEFAPLNRLGFEVELPFIFYYPVSAGTKAPNSKLNSLKFGSQYSFYVSEKNKTSMAIGYIHEFHLTEFADYGRGKLFRGSMYNPFFIAAKRWGQHFHTLLYTGPQFAHYSEHGAGGIDALWQINSNFHYMIPGTRNFIGVELNKEIYRGDFDMTIRPQMRVSVADNLLIGIVTGVPINRENQRFSTFLRFIYEPSHKH